LCRSIPLDQTSVNLLEKGPEYKQNLLCSKELGRMVKELLTNGQ